MGDTDSFSPIYLVCGLRVRSDRRIPDLLPVDPGPVDVAVQFLGHSQSELFDGERTLRYASRALTESGESTVRLWQISSPISLYQLTYADGTQFVIDEPGSKVWATWGAGSTFEDTLTYFLGPVLGFVLRLRGVTCLHSSAVAVDDVAIALTGTSGAGKSTMAAQFSSMGYPVLSDDITTLGGSAASFVVQPSTGRLRLWPSSVEHLYGHAHALPRLTPSWEKQYLDLRTGGRRFQSAPLPLGAIYVLNQGQESADEISEITGSAAMMQLLGNVYVNYLLEEDFRQRDFVRIAKLVNAVPVRKVNLRHNFEMLAQTCRAIACDFRRIRNRRPIQNGPSTSMFVSCVE